MSGQIQPTGMGPLARPMPPRVPVAPAAVMTPRDIFIILRRHVIMITMFTVASFLIAIAAWWLLKRYHPAWTATALVQVLPQGITDPLQIGQTEPGADIQFQFRNTKAAMMKQPGFIREEFLSRTDVRQTTWFKNLRIGWWDRLRGRGAAEGEGSDAEAIVRAVDYLEKHLAVIPQREGSFIRVSFTCRGKTGKKESALLVNDFVDSFIGTELATARRNLSNRLTPLTAQQAIIVRDLAEVNGKLLELRNTAETLKLSPNVAPAMFKDYLDEKLASLETEWDKLESEIQRLEAEVATLLKRAEGQYDEVVREQVEQDPVTSVMRRNVTELQVSLAQLTARFGEGHRRVREISDALRQAEEDLAKRQLEMGDLWRKTEYILAQDRVTAAKQEMAIRTERLLTARREYRDLAKLRGDYERILLTRDEKQTLLETVNTHIEKVRALIDDPELPKVQSLGPVPEPLEISSPKWQVYFPGGLLLGLLAGVGLAFAIELLNDLVRTPRDVVRHLHVPLLGMICHEEEDDDLDGIDPYHAVRKAPYSVTGECYRQLRTNLTLSAGPEPQKALLITSCSPGDGKTSVALNMAAAFVAEDRKVLLIDANFRRPWRGLDKLQTELRSSTQDHPDFGLSNYLLGQMQDVQSIVRGTGIEGFDLVDGGPLPPNPAEALGGPRMKRLLEELRSRYDYVLLDGPALLVSDAKALAACVDGTILVFNAATTRRGAAERALRELRSINARVVGTVLLGVKTFKGGYFEEMFRAYQKYQQVRTAQPV